MGEVLFKITEFFIDTTFGKILIIMATLAMGIYFVADQYDCSVNKHGLYVKQAFSGPVCIEQGKH